MYKCLLFFFIAVAFVYADGDSSSSEEDLRSLKTFVENKLNLSIINDFAVFSEKTKKQCPDIEQKIETASDEISNCIESIDTGDETFCALIRNNLERCSEPVKKLLLGCLPEESKGLPVLGIKIVAAIIDEACNSTVEQILELFNPCALEKNFGSFESCTKVRDVAAEFNNKIPSKALVCSLLPNLKSCIKSHRDASCKNPVTKSAIVNFFEAVDHATATECQDVNKTK